MNAMATVHDVSKRWWFIALYRWAVVALVPMVSALAVWVVVTVNATQISMAAMDTKLTAVIVRVDKMEDADTRAVGERIEIATKLTELRTTTANLAHAVDRLTAIIDRKIP